MSLSQPAGPGGRPARSLRSSSSSVGPTMGITIYGCGPDEAAVFRRIAPRLGVIPTLVETSVSEANIGQARGNRCISVDHRTHVSNATLQALSRAGVAYVSTRSVGFDHVNVEYAESVGVRIENVRYSPDSVADYTLMLMLMAIRHAKSIVRRTDGQDYRLSDVPGKELRDLTVGVIGTGRIGTAVVHRLQGFGCRILAHDNGPTSGAHYVPLDELIQQSDIVTLHTPLNAGTHHLIDDQRIGRMKPGAIVVNTGRGSLIDTWALVSGLESGRLGGAALDVLEGEEEMFHADRRGEVDEGAALSRLQRLPNVFISPHTAYHTDHALNDMVENTILNCLTFEGKTAAWTG